MADFHFLRPLWLWLLPVMALLLWRLAALRFKAGSWRDVIDEALLEHVLIGAALNRRSLRWPLLLAGAALVIAIGALAGPTWERQSTPAFRSDEAMVVVLDLSRSMDATDLKPSRLVRAKLKLLDLLDERDRGQTALVVFSAHAFTVTPLTTDTRTIAQLVVSLSTDIMPSQGSYPEVGLDKARQLLTQASVKRGQVLLITDSEVHPDTLESAATLRSAGHRLHVLGVGTADGGPVLNEGGGFLADAAGQVVVARLDEAGLKRMAVTGGGRYTTMGVGQDDLSQLITTGPGEIAVDEAEDAFETALWQDQGAWLALVLLPLAALAFRRGWLLVLATALILPVDPVQAFQFSDLWLRRDQQGYQAFQQERVEEAATLFEDPRWRAAAQYRSGEYAASAEALDGIDGPLANYNRANSLARAGSFSEAIAAYDRTLELDPGHEDAAYNRQLLLENMPQPPPGQEGQQDQQDADDQGEGQEEQSTGEQNPGEGEQQPGEQQGDPSQGENQPQEGETAEQAAQRQAEEAMSDWASEQAADQWLRRIPDDPGGLLRRKFRYQYQRLGRDQDGNDLWPGDEEQPW